MYVRLVRVMIESGGLLCGSSRAHELLLYYIACCRQTEEDSQLPNLLHCIALHCIVCILSWKEYGFYRHVHADGTTDRPMATRRRSPRLVLCVIFSEATCTCWTSTYIDRRGSGMFPTHLWSLHVKTIELHANTNVPARKAGACTRVQAL